MSRSIRRALAYTPLLICLALCTPGRVRAQASPGTATGTSAAKTEEDEKKIPKPSVEFKDSALALTLGPDRKSEATIFLQNRGTVAATVEFSAILKDNNGQPGTGVVTLTSADKRIDPDTIKAFTVIITAETMSLPLSGYIRLEATSDDPNQPKAASDDPKKPKAASFLPVTLSPPAPASYLVWVPMGVAVLVTLIPFLVMLNKKKVSPLDKMGSPTWSFKESWASNLTLASGALVTALTFTALPERTEHFSKTGYLTLTFIFAALIGIAPFVYNIVRKPVETVNPAGLPVVQHHGYVGLFLLACLLTIWGVIGQLITLWFNVDEIVRANLVVSDVVSMLKYILWAVGIMMLFYAGFSIGWTIDKQKIEKEATRERAATERARAAAAGTEASRTAARVSVEQPSLPDWSLL